MFSDNESVYIIAEAGVNHNGRIEIAKKMIDAAAECNVDAIKFQSFIPEKLATRDAPVAEYQQEIDGMKGSQLELLRSLFLSHDNFKKIIDYCSGKGITFISSAFDCESAAFLDELGLKIFKIPSGEITNLPLLRMTGSFGHEILLSTGMATLKEVKDALSVLIKAGTPKEKITVLHCTTAYPSPFPDLNLNAISIMKKKLGVHVGYSDHSIGIEVPVAAVALGAKVIEKHFTLNRNMQGPDHKASIEPDELQEMVKYIRNIERALGDGIKKPTSSELRNIRVVRKSIVARKNINKGDKFSECNLAIKRPGTGLSPMEWDHVLGKKAKKNFSQDDFIEL
jgi:N,N'-diacetyllegionaminate synthase